MFFFKKKTIFLVFYLSGAMKEAIIGSFWALETWLSPLNVNVNKTPFSLLKYGLICRPTSLKIQVREMERFWKKVRDECVGYIPP